MDFMELYGSIKKLLKSFKKKNYWNSFTSADLFYIADEKTNGLFTFIDQFFGDSYGCQLFFTKKGFNYVHDVLTAKSEDSIYFWDCDAICCALIEKKNLAKKDIEFLHKHKIRVQTENNLLIYRFEPGYQQRCANNKEMVIFNDFLTYVNSLLSNEFNQIIEGFHNNLTPIALIDNVNMTYSFLLRDLPYLETLPYKHKANMSFVQEFKDATYLDDECYMYTTYLPVVIRENGVRPLLVYFYFPNINKSYIKYIADKPKEYKNCIYGIIYDLFTTVGLPTKMIISDRDFYSYLEKTLKEMKIEVVFNKDNEVSSDNVKEVISSVYRNTIEEVVDDLEFVNLFMKAITDIINNVVDQDDIIEDKPDFGQNGLVS